MPSSVKENAYNAWENTEADSCIQLCIVIAMHDWRERAYRCRFKGKDGKKQQHRPGVDEFIG